MYTYEIDAQAMFEDRSHQFEKFGIPAHDIAKVLAAVDDMWADTPGGWVYEWSALAQEYADRGDHGLAAYAFGCAKFPCLTDAARERAMNRQLEQYELAAKNFEVRFERRIIELPYRGGTIEMPVHLYSTDGDHARRPVLMTQGGVDTFKLDFHPFCVAFTTGSDMTTLAFDNPGTGECPVPLDGFADEIIRGIAAYARALGDGRVAHFGMSFGGNFSAMSGLTGLVDAAVNLGGPMAGAFEPDHAAALPYGMPDILGNAMHYDRPPTTAELVAGLHALSRRDLFARETNSPMLVINGADDYFVPQSDTLVFAGRTNTEVQLLPDTGHCAMSKAPEVVPAIAGWLVRQFGTQFAAGSTS